MHEVLTPHGQKLANNAFKSIDPRDNTISIEHEVDRYACTVSSNRTNCTYYCWFPTTYDVMMFPPFLVDAPVEFPTQMLSHAITCVQWSSLTGLKVSMRQRSCQYGGILPVGESSILLILLYGRLLTWTLFAIQQLLQNQTKWS